MNDKERIDALELLLFRWCEYSEIGETLAPDTQINLYNESRAMLSDQQKSERLTGNQIAALMFLAGESRLNYLTVIGNPDNTPMVYLGNTVERVNRRTFRKFRQLGLIEQVRRPADWRTEWEVTDKGRRAVSRHLTVEKAKSWR